MINAQLLDYQCQHFLSVLDHGRLVLKVPVSPAGPVVAEGLLHAGFQTLSVATTRTATAPPCNQWLHHGCGCRTKSITDSGANRSVNPIEHHVSH